MSTTTPPAPTDGRIPALPRTAVNVAARLWQIANKGQPFIAQVVVVEGVWLLIFDGKMERLGEEKPHQFDNTHHNVVT